MPQSMDMPQNQDQSDLHTGQTPWGVAGRRPFIKPLPESTKADVLIVGGGITGSMIGQHLAARGLDVVIADRERPGFGSTAASTAMLLWEIDRSLGDLTQLYGFDHAAEVYRHSLAAMAGLRNLVTGLELDCRFVPRSTLYIAAEEGDAAKLLDEHRLRSRAALPGDYLGHATLLSGFGIDRAAAIYSPGAAEADPLLLSWGLLERAMQSGARLIDAEITAYDHGPKCVVVQADDGNVIEARHVVLATGYVMPDFLKSDLHKTVSSYAIATVPQAKDKLWPAEALIWEASEDYLYARTTTDGRIIIGGGDDDTTDPEKRAKKLVAKTDLLVEKLSRLWPRALPSVDYSWSGAFGQTVDGLPLIGPVPSMPRILAAYGYGGNGITFSYMASRMLAALIAGERQGWFEAFALDRPPG
ncbi:glycine/D-amino acid oxidase-like deaminating enzyme [Pararhizobium capsulatum DSM 1112]|uniref:Glycine/D-amino acid oxidase-like deaminating enzyme n=1 Tax=Pararhizobium capsulatum DSM 1112 TaxID=1121113 RepID=A0ABU0BLY4_9HYPH|nr:FAD-dependent oxidoreductase [Pararhizobium capsulatum]MDQ0319241.1 glycine/D-amino acid oxidase-like deaminating enzyme [Pararhizobium capsulatum DSM 1112]